jgi:hypothetical protein
MKFKILKICSLLLALMNSVQSLDMLKFEDSMIDQIVALNDMDPPGIMKQSSSFGTTNLDDFSTNEPGDGFPEPYNDNPNPNTNDGFSQWDIRQLKTGSLCFLFIFTCMIGDKAFMLMMLGSEKMSSCDLMVISAI